MARPSSTKPRCKLCGAVLSKAKVDFCDVRCADRFAEEYPRKAYDIFKRGKTND